MQDVRTNTNNFRKDWIQMKKLIIAAICIILLTGCGSEKNVKQKDTKQVEQQVENLSLIHI